MSHEQMRELIRLKDLALARLETRVAHSIEVDDIKRQLDVSTRTHNSFLFYVFISLQFLSELVFTHTHTLSLSLSLSLLLLLLYINAFYVSYRAFHLFFLPA